MPQPIQRITQTDPNYPERIKHYLKTETPETIWARGNVNSIFTNQQRSSTVLANQRNDFVAALADKICIAHAAEDSKTLTFAQTVIASGKPVFTFETSANDALFQLGAQPLLGGT